MIKAKPLGTRIPPKTLMNNAGRATSNRSQNGRIEKCANYAHSTDNLSCFVGRYNNFECETWV